MVQLGSDQRIVGDGENVKYEGHKLFVARIIRCATKYSVIAIFQRVKLKHVRAAALVRFNDSTRVDAFRQQNYHLDSRSRKALSIYHQSTTYRNLLLLRHADCVDILCYLLETPLGIRASLDLDTLNQGGHSVDTSHRLTPNTSQVHPA